MKTNAALWAVVGAMILFGGMRVRAAEDEGRPAELKVLDRWVGDWDLEIIVKPGPASPAGSKSTYKSVVRRAINDRFIKGESEGFGVAGERKFADGFLWMCTYDPSSKTYKSTVCWSTVEGGKAGFWGMMPVGTGTWEEKEQTMSIRTEDKDTGTLSISVTQWIDKDTHRFAQSITERNGKVVVEMSGMAKRRK